MERGKRMSMLIRPEVAKKNKYYISRHRYYELKHYCLQYNEWKENITLLTPKISRGEFSVKQDGIISDPTSRIAIKRAYYSNLIKQLEDCCIEADKEIGKYILLAVTQDLSYQKLLAKYDVPFSKQLYYNRYRRFFWLLSKIRE